MSVSDLPLHKRSLSLDHSAFINLLTHSRNLLIIQDLDGVCMGLVKDPLTRTIDKDYIEATRLFDHHFYVLTNGEHIGRRGVNRLVEKAFSNSNLVKEQRLYLPGLAGGGVQWQDRYGTVTHPGVNQEELSFLAEVPRHMEAYLQNFFKHNSYGLEEKEIAEGIQTSVLENKVSPSVNLNVWHEVFYDQEAVYQQLQIEIANLMERLLEKAEEKGLGTSFFVHYAPNLGKDAQGKEIMQLGQGKDSGTTDFQFMLRGAIKEVGLLAILNHYYYYQTRIYPLGEDFNVRQAPHDPRELLDLIKENFDPSHMPIMVGVGDTVTSKAVENGGEIQFQRGGSDRGFLQLIQAIGQELNQGNVIVYVDSSYGEVKNRKSLKLEHFINHETINTQKEIRVVEGPGDSRDQDDPLTLNIVFPEGHQQYIQCFQKAACQRQKIIS